MIIYVRDFEGNLHSVDADPEWTVGRFKNEATTIANTTKGVEVVLEGRTLGDAEWLWEVGVEAGGVVDLAVGEVEMKKLKYITEVKTMKRRGASSGDILYIAVVEDNLPLVLAIHEVDPTAFNPEKLYYNPILLALPNPHLFSPLYDCGVPLTIQDPIRGSPLLIAVSTSNLPAITELASLGVDLNEEDELHRTPLTAAISAASFTSTLKLLQLGADPNKATVYGTPLTLSCGNREILNILISHGADPSTLDNFGRSTLQRYLESGGRDVGTVVKLVENGADVNGVSTTGRTPLLHAVSEGDPCLVDALVSRGARVNLRTEAGTPLSLAVTRSSLESVRLLTKAGADLQAVTPYGATLLDVAKTDPVIHSYLRSKGVVPRPVSVALFPLLLIASLATPPSSPNGFYMRCAAALFAPSCVAFSLRVLEAWRG